MQFSEIEITHLTKAWVAISLAFAILLSGGNMFSPQFITMLMISGVTVGSGFLLHEMGHKYVAQRYNCFAEFRADNKMLLLAIGMSFFGFIFAAPGAVMIQGFVTRERNGKISIAGPLVNIVLAIIFVFLLFVNILPTVSGYGAIINSWIAAFNMIPIGNIDGKKILNWNKVAYFTTAGAAVLLLVFSYRLFSF